MHCVLGTAETSELSAAAYDLQSKLLKGVIGDNIGSIIRVIKGDTGSLD